MPLNRNWIAVIGATVDAWTPTPRYRPLMDLGAGLPSCRQNLYVKIGIWTQTSRHPPTAPTARFSAPVNVARVGVVDDAIVSADSAVGWVLYLTVESFQHESMMGQSIDHPT
mmetsp:Transcript_18444/g.44532  ORF Transcript_18444/g.44532 Transcript_18444/m.44532 type:complete len:112 (+) Transcript_18444:789-1124(+)